MRTLRIALATIILSAFASAQTLVFHNTMGSLPELSASVVGPALVPATGADGLYVVATPWFAPGIDGQAVGPGASAPPYFYHPNHSRVQLMRLDNDPPLVNLDRGTIEVIVRVLTPPLAGGPMNDIRLFDGPYGANSGLTLLIGDLLGNGQMRVCFAIKGPATAPGGVVQAHSNEDGQHGADITGQIDTWLHIAAIWDRAGIAGSPDRMRIYVNGQLRATEDLSNWVTTLGPVFDIGGSTGEPLGRYLIDDVKLYDGAKTAFPPPFQLVVQMGYLSGAVDVINAFGAPYHYAMNFFTFNTANASGGLGSGWLAGLHMTMDEAFAEMGAMTSFVGPFFMPLDEFGNARVAYPTASLAFLSGMTLYGVGLHIDPLTFQVDAMSVPFEFVIP